MSRYGGVSRYDGGIAGSAQRVLVGVLIVIDADSTELADVSIYDGEGGMHGSAQRDLSNVGPVGEKTNAGADAERVGVGAGACSAGVVFVVGGDDAAVAALCFSFARRWLKSLRISCLRNVFAALVTGGFGGGGGDISLSLSLAELDESQRNACPAVTAASLLVTAALGVVVGFLGGSGFACASHSTGFRFSLGEIVVVVGVVVGEGEFVVGGVGVGVPGAAAVVVAVAGVLEVVVVVGVITKNAEVVGGVLKFWS